MLTARSESADTSSVAGSLSTRPPAGIVNERLPLNVSARSVPGTMLAPLSRRATCAAAITIGVAPKVLEMRTRTRSPPMLVWTMYRTVWSLNCGAGPAGPAGPVAQVPTHRDRPAWSSAWTPADHRNATATQAQANVRFLMDLNIRSPRERVAGHRDGTAPKPRLVSLRRSASCRALCASKARRAESCPPATREGGPRQRGTPGDTCGDMGPRTSIRTCRAWLER